MKGFSSELALSLVVIPLFSPRTGTVPQLKPFVTLTLMKCIDQLLCKMSLICGVFLYFLMIKCRLPSFGRNIKNVGPSYQVALNVDLSFIDYIYFDHWNYIYFWFLVAFSIVKLLFPLYSIFRRETLKL